MKNLNWKQWTGFGIIVAIIIAAIVCHLVQPTVTYAWLEIVSIITFICGCFAGRMIKKELK